MLKFASIRPHYSVASSLSRFYVAKSGIAAARQLRPNCSLPSLLCTGYCSMPLRPTRAFRKRGGQRRAAATANAPKAYCSQGALRWQRLVCTVEYIPFTPGWAADGRSLTSARIGLQRTSFSASVMSSGRHQAADVQQSSVIRALAPGACWDAANFCGAHKLPRHVSHS